MRREESGLKVRLASCKAEVLSAQALRYRVFVSEMRSLAESHPEDASFEQDAFDVYCDHLILIDSTNSIEKVVGTTRLLRGDQAAKGIGFYSSSEFDLSKISKTERPCLEIGRSCLDTEYRGGLGALVLWAGIAEYVNKHKIEIIFGTASFGGTDPSKVSQALSFLQNRHLAPLNLRAKVRAEGAAEHTTIAASEIDRLMAVRQMPALIKAYLRFGGRVGEGVFVDDVFQTLDVCMILDVAAMTPAQKTQFQRPIAQVAPRCGTAA